MPSNRASSTHLVLIPSYNPGVKVEDTVRSARAQWNPVWVVVDGSTDGSTAKRTHFGLEVGFFPLDSSTNLFTLRAGINGNSPSFGVEFSLWHSLTIQYVVFREEYGKVAGDDSRKRQLLQVNLLGF